MLVGDGYQWNGPSLVKLQISPHNEVYFSNYNHNGGSMSIIHMIGIDLAKNVFQYHSTDRHGHKISGGTWNRSQMMQQIQATPPCIIAIEACGGSH